MRLTTPHPLSHKGNANMPKYMHDCLLMALARLDPTHPGFNASREVRKAMENINLRCYLDSWVLPLLRCADQQPGSEWTRAYAASDAAYVRAKMAAAQRTQPTAEDAAP